MPKISFPIADTIINPLPMYRINRSIFLDSCTLFFRQADPNHRISPNKYVLGLNYNVRFYQGIQGLLAFKRHLTAFILVANHLPPSCLYPTTPSKVVRLSYCC